MPVHAAIARRHRALLAATASGYERRAPLRIRWRRVTFTTRGVVRIGNGQPRASAAVHRALRRRLVRRSQLLSVLGIRRGRATTYRFEWQVECLCEFVEIRVLTWQVVRHHARRARNLDLRLTRLWQHSR